MFRTKGTHIDVYILISIISLVGVSTFSLFSLEPFLYPEYFIFIGIGLISYFVFSKIDFSVYKAFANHIYIGSIILLIVPLVIGQVTRGAVRWIPLGDISIQPSELVRPFLVLFMANYMTRQLTLRTIYKPFVLMALPIVLILIQPSLGVAILTFVSFVGVILASSLNKRQLLLYALLLSSLIPILWLMLAPYQKLRLQSFLDPSKDPLGTGYNSIQSMISVGSGGWLGRGINEGVQTQLEFLPEKHTDFIFAAVNEELGLLGASIVIGFLTLILVRLIYTLERPKSAQSRMYTSGIFLVMLTQVVFNVGMNMGLFPISGIPLPLVSAGGSSFIATMISLGVINQAGRWQLVNSSVNL